MHMHMKRGCRLARDDSEEEQVENKEDSDNSLFCTPATCSPEKHPLITRKIVKHFDATGCDIIGLERRFESRRGKNKSGSYHYHWDGYAHPKDKKQSYSVCS